MAADHEEKIRKTAVSLNQKAILVTGAAGFIGSSLVYQLLRRTEGAVIVGIDCMTDYNPLELKEWRLRQIEKEAEKSRSRWVWIKGDIADKGLVDKLFKTYQFQITMNLAAQAGVRYSITNPESYIHSNLIGFYNLLEAARHDARIEHFVYASSSSVYGGNKKVPFSTDDKVDSPVSLYAATKKSDELMAHAYAKLYNIPSTGLEERICFISAQLTAYAREKLFRYLITGTVREISPILMILLRVFCLCCRGPRRKRTERMAFRFLHMRYITSAVGNPRIS